MYCYNCGKKLAKNANYCVYCGEKVVIPEDEENTIEKPFNTIINHTVDGEISTIRGSVKSNFPNRLTDKSVNVDLKVLEERLKSYRKTMADIEHIPSFCVFNNKTLVSILETLPTTYEEIKNVYGFGDVKISKYGKDIVEIINQLDMNNL